MSCALPAGTGVAGAEDTVFLTALPLPMPVFAGPPSSIVFFFWLSSASFAFLAASSSSSRFLSYPSWRTRSSSASASFCALSKSKELVTFVAFRPPSFFAPEDAPDALEEAPRRLAPNRAGLDAVLEEEEERREAEVTVRGAGGVEAARTGTMAGDGLDEVAGAFVSSLSQLSKKSSSAASLGFELVWMSVAPSTKMPLGNLRERMSYIALHNTETYLTESSFTLFASSSLYSSAALLEYFFLVSESFSSTEPPCFVKKSVADAFPPTFIVLSWKSCQESRFVDLLIVSFILHAHQPPKYAPHEAQMYPHVPMDAAAVQADIYAERYARPCRISCLTIKACL